LSILFAQEQENKEILIKNGKMNNTRHLLFICSKNEWRSRTAETIFRNTEGINVKSAGTSSVARIRVNANLINWAELIFVMEDTHKKRITADFGDLLENKTVIVLDIPDEYPYMDEELITELRDSVAHYLE